MSLPDAFTAPVTVRPRELVAGPIASRATDPRFYDGLAVLPNPDAVLRKLGKSAEVYDAIAHDGHVLGELRSVRAGLLRYEHRVVPGGATAADARAAALCEARLREAPAPGMRWSDLLWSLHTAILYGASAVEPVWQRYGDVLMPASLHDVPFRRLAWGPDGGARVLTRAEPLRGEAVLPYRLLMARHMPSYEQPYGLAALSGCFWPYTFKHLGLRSFAKLCEKFGMPWAIGQYPEGTGDQSIQALIDGLARMIEDGVGAVPLGGEVQLIEPSSSGEPVSERLIQRCNAEMSKALTSQTAATELVRGSGSRAAAETHAAREHGVQDADRDLVADAMSELFAWITTLNVAGAVPPRFEFFEEADARAEWTDVLDKARAWLPIPTAFAYERLQIRAPAAGEAVLPAGSAQPAIAGKLDTPEFAAPPPAKADPIDTLTRQALRAAAPATTALIDEVAALIARYEREGKSLDDLEQALATLYPSLDLTQLGEITSAAMEAAYLTGLDEASHDETP